MKLYYSAGSCSTSCHLTLEESGLKYEAIEVDFDNEQDPNLKIANKLNPLGTLPVFLLDDGVKQLDQNLAIHMYVADKVPEKNLLPAAGTFERYEAMNLLSFVATDLHKGVGALFGLNYMTKNESTKDEVRKYLLENANKYLHYLDTKLNGKEYLLGKSFSVVDSYAFVVTGWTKWLEVPLTPYKNIESYMSRVAARPAVAKVLKDEGLN
jgi:glutathione S-transferase